MGGLIRLSWDNFNIDKYDDNICLGCFLSLNEVNQWHTASNKEHIIMHEKCQ